VPTVMMQSQVGGSEVKGCPVSIPLSKFEIASTILEEHARPAGRVTEPGEKPCFSHRPFKRIPLIFNSGSRV